MPRRRAMMKKLLHEPIARLRDLSAAARRRRFATSSVLTATRPEVRGIAGSPWDTGQPPRSKQGQAGCFGSRKGDKQIALETVEIRTEGDPTARLRHRPRSWRARCCLPLKSAGADPR